MLLGTDWVSFFKKFRTLIIGFSGGLDSTVLLHALASLPFKKQLLAVHIHHGISANALMWQQHCETFCKNSSIEFLTQNVEFDRQSNKEEGARIARYEFFSSLLTTEDCLVLGHHRDDQVETVLLQLFRGAGVDGLAAMPETAVLGSGLLARPLLMFSRKQLEAYALKHRLQWIEDESNQDVSYSRNFLRHDILPLIVKKWPGVFGNIARTAQHCQSALMNLEILAVQDSPELQTPSDSLFIQPLKQLPHERIANVLRFWLKKNTIQLPSTLTFERLIHELIFASQDAMPLVCWDEIRISRYQEHIYLVRTQEPTLSEQIPWPDFPHDLTDKVHLIVQKSTEGMRVPMKSVVTIRFRKGGERFIYHGNSRQLKKLFQEWGVPPWLRGTIPLVYINDELAAVVGYAVSDVFFTKNTEEACVVLMKKMGSTGIAGGDNHGNSGRTKN